MKIGIVGAGFTGLSAAYYLSKLGYNVTVFEKEESVGGLGGGIKKKNWKWALDRNYHHFFTNDKSAFKLAREVGQKIYILRPKTSTLIDGKIYQLDSPLSLLKFPLLNFFERIKMGISLALLRYSPFYHLFDRFKAEDVLPKLMGNKGFETIWKPLFKAKFTKFEKDVSLAWFWARIKKRTTSLAYPEEGFLGFATRIKNAAEKNGCKFILNAEVIEAESSFLRIKKSGKIIKENYDKIIITTATPIFLGFLRDLQKPYYKKLQELKSLSAINLLLRFKKPFLSDNTYWLNVCEKDSRLMAVVEHTNFINKKFYNNEALVYIAHYVPSNHPYLKMSKKDLLKVFDPELQKLKPNYQNDLIDFDKSSDLYAQPVIRVNYATNIPPFNTPLTNVYLANMDQIFPWDRGVNYAIELGQKIAHLVIKN